MAPKPLLELSRVNVHFPVKTGLFKRRYVKAVNDVSLRVYPGDILGIVGESGCGKSTLARSIVGLSHLTSGKISYLGHDLSQKGVLQQYRSDVQMIFQDPLAALNPRMTIGESIAEPLHGSYSKQEIQHKVQVMLDKVGLLPEMMYRYPHELSGGQCQRVGIARALITEPKLIICDEVVSALDVSIQAQMINLLMDLQQELQLTLIFIAHDLAVVKHIADQVVVMYLGHLVETASKEHLFKQPLHPYTKALLDAVPIVDPRRARAKQIQLLSGELPSPLKLPSGCVFRTRCPIADDFCVTDKPRLTLHSQHQVACLKVTE